MGISIVRSKVNVRTVIPADWRTVLGRFSSDVRDAFEERAAIIEYDGGEPRPTAERRAFECMLDDFEEAAQALRAHLLAVEPGRGKSMVKGAA